MVLRSVSVVCSAALIAGLPATAWADDTVTDPTPTAEPTPTPEPTTEPEPTAKPKHLPRQLVIGESRRGRPIVAKRQGRADAERVLLVLGQMHGDEPYGRYVVDQVRKLKPRKNTAVWTIRTMNPDGAKLRTRRNANRVDLNRNFPDNWQAGDPGSLFYAGPRPASEPETRAFMAEIQRNLEARGAKGQIVLVGEAVLAGNVPDITASLRKEVYTKVRMPQPATLGANDVMGAMRSAMTFVCPNPE